MLSTIIIVRVLNDCSFASTIILCVHMGVLQYLLATPCSFGVNFTYGCFALLIGNSLEFGCEFSVLRYCRLISSNNGNVLHLSPYLNCEFETCTFFFSREFYCPVFSIYSFMVLFSRFAPLQLMSNNGDNRSMLLKFIGLCC